MNGIRHINFSILAEPHPSFPEAAVALLTDDEVVEQLACFHNLLGDLDVLGSGVCGLPKCDCAPPL
jgi:hypothetical protein